MRVQPGVFFGNRQSCRETDVVGASRYQRLEEAALQEAEKTGQPVHFNAGEDETGMGTNTASPIGHISGWWWWLPSRSNLEQTAWHTDSDRADYERALAFDRLVLGESSGAEG